MASALKKISTGDADSGIMQKMFGDHPDTSKRIKNVEDRSQLPEMLNNQRLNQQKTADAWQQFRGFFLFPTISDQIV